MASKQALRFKLRLIRLQHPSAAASSAYKLSDLELASRLSFFLWSSIPDEHLLALAERASFRIRDARKEVRRMLADPRPTPS